VITYKTNTPLDIAQIAATFIAAGIRRPADDLPRIDSMFQHADIVISAWDADQLIGLCRALTDYSYCCYLSDLAVVRDYQRQGIGEKMVEILRNALGPQVSIILLASDEAMDYYPKLGFLPATNAYVIKRQS
jgi:GNAT superfamily N-acetyltransferase